MSKNKLNNKTRSRRTRCRWHSSRKDVVLKQDFRLYRKGKMQMKEQGNENISQKIVPKDEQGLEIPACKKGDSAVLGYSDYPLDDGVTYRVWSASNDDMSPQERLQNLMVRSAESGEEVGDQVSWQQKEEERILRETIEAMPERCRPKPDPFLEQRENELMKYRKMTDPYEMKLPDEEEELDIKMDM